MGWPRRLLGIALLAVAAVLAMAALMALLDPTSKMADDADPFGAPIPASSALLGLLLSLVLAALGFWLTFRTKRRRDDSVLRGLAPIAIAAAAALQACALYPPLRPPPPEFLLTQAIEQAGGEAALTAARPGVERRRGGPRRRPRSAHRG
jgi:peptidoglycan/LPS O-acetylase OafA/YrhL